jgi:hypothetical protein
VTSLRDLMQRAMERYVEWCTSRYGSDLEQYLESKNARTTAEIEYWIKQYTYSRHYI